MNPTINRLKILFLILFAVGAVGIWSYQIFYVWPAQKCDERQGWWDRRNRVCAAPIFIPSLTGRPAGVSRKEWSVLQAARESQREREGYDAEAAAAQRAAEPKPAAPVPAAKPAAK